MNSTTRPEGAEVFEKFGAGTKTTLGVHTQYSLDTPPWYPLPPVSPPPMAWAYRQTPCCCDAIASNLDFHGEIGVR